MSLMMVKSMVMIKIWRVMRVSVACCHGKHAIDGGRFIAGEPYDLEGRK